MIQINLLDVRFFKTYPEMKTQYFGFLTSLSEEELRNSPRLQSHASGVLLGITHIVNGLENPVRVIMHSEDKYNNNGVLEWQGKI